MSKPEHLKPLVQIVELCLASGFVKNERPVNLLISSKPEAGKTMVLELFSQIPKCAYLTDCTAYGILKNLLKDLDSGNLKYIIIPDLLKPLSRKPSTVNDFIAFMNALLEEGVVTIFTYAITIERRNLKCGLITSLPEGELLDRRRKWVRLGFLSRMLPFTYSFNENLIKLIFQKIQNREYNTYEHIMLKLDEKDIKLDPNLAKELELDARTIGMAQSLYGFRAMRQLQTLAMASALLNGRDEVIKEDIDYVKSLSRWMNFDFNPL